MPYYLNIVGAQGARECFLTLPKFPNFLLYHHTNVSSRMKKMI
jgi:hypothetical protein